MNSKKVTVEAVGEGIGVRLPKDLAKRAKIAEGTEVYITLVDGVLQIADVENAIAIPMMTNPGSRFLQQKALVEGE